MKTKLIRQIAFPLENRYTFAVCSIRLAKGSLQRSIKNRAWALQERLQELRNYNGERLFKSMFLCFKKSHLNKTKK